MTIYAVDPGPVTSAVCVWKDGEIAFCEAEMPNDLVKEYVTLRNQDAVLAVEWIECFGMPVGSETFETVFFCGQLSMIWSGRMLRVPRRAVKVYLCGSVKAKDGNVRRALIDRIGPQGTKKSPGPTYGVSSHGWQALGVAVTAQAKLDGDPDLACVVWNDEV